MPGSRTWEINNERNKNILNECWIVWEREKKNTKAYIKLYMIFLNPKKNSTIHVNIEHFYSRV